MLVWGGRASSRTVKTCLREDQPDFLLYLLNLADFQLQRGSFQNRVEGSLVESSNLVRLADFSSTDLAGRANARSMAVLFDERSIWRAPTWGNISSIRALDGPLACPIHQP